MQRFSEQPGGPCATLTQVITKVVKEMVKGAFERVDESAAHAADSVRALVSAHRVCVAESACIQLVDSSGSRGTVRNRQLPPLPPVPCPSVQPKPYILNTLNPCHRCHRCLRFQGTEDTAGTVRGIRLNRRSDDGMLISASRQRLPIATKHVDVSSVACAAAEVKNWWDRSHSRFHTVSRNPEHHTHQGTSSSA